jgi:hypothetical protein
MKRRHRSQVDQIDTPGRARFHFEARWGRISMRPSETTLLREIAVSVGRTGVVTRSRF